MGWEPDRRWDEVDIIQRSILTEEELAQVTALNRHFAGTTGLTHPGVRSINFLPIPKRKEKNSANF